MAPPATTQRIEFLEEQTAEIQTRLASLQSTIAEQISSSVISAMETVKQTMDDQIAADIEQAIQISKEELEIANYRIEGRIDRTRENVEGTLAKFQAEIRLSLTALHPAAQMEPHMLHQDDTYQGEGDHTQMDGFRGAFNFRSSPSGGGGGNINWRFNGLTYRCLRGQTQMGGSYEPRSFLAFTDSVKRRN